MSTPLQEEARALKGTIELGFDFEDFLRDPRMVRVAKDLEHSRSQLVELLLKCSAMDSQQIGDIQKQIWAIDNWQAVIAAYVTEGRNAQAQFASMDAIPEEE